MPSVADNIRVWNTECDWRHGGDAWSWQFGGTEALWWFVLYPRIHRFLPATKILEIAPGYGRWTQFLKNHCQSMIAVDISENCIENCKNRFANDNYIEFHVNDGYSLAIVPDESIDFVFSFDSLVHAENDVMESYLIQLAKKLRPNGVGFIHHSNMGFYRKRLAILSAYRSLPAVFRKRILREEHMERLLSINVGGWRAPSMTGDLFCKYCKQAGLRCVSQELINWNNGRCLIDAISVIAKPGSRWDRENAYLENGRFVESAVVTGELARLYCP
jgi:SAM-dependent methyltransferase